MPSHNTPRLILSPRRALDAIASLSEAIAGDNAQILLAQKSCPSASLIASIIGSLRGLSCSSRFEVRLARSLMPSGYVAFVGSGMSQSCHEYLDELCDSVTMNSLTEWLRIRGPNKAAHGLRVNPGVSIVDDPRYDPCRSHSKLGVPLDKIRRAWSEGDLNGISGIHFHTACCTTSWEPLLRTVKVIEKQLAPMMHELEWINVGGGYQWDKSTDFAPLQEAVDLLTNTYYLEVFLEPGDGIVNAAGSLIASVVDLFESDGKMVAILDTTVNHFPEVFEYRYEPDVASHVDGAPHEYILAGCSCLAGDLFGKYTFEEPLDIGSRITFENVGAYSMVKANMFNGINLPSIYIQREDGELELVREFTYDDFLARCGGEAHAAARAGV